MVRRHGARSGPEARLTDSSWDLRSRRGENSMKTGTIRRRAGLVCFAIGAAALRGILFHPQVYAQEAPKHTVFYTHGRIYTNDPAEPSAEALAVADGTRGRIGKMAHVPR